MAVEDRNRAWNELSVQEQLDLHADPRYADRIRSRSEYSKEFDTFMAQMKVARAAGDRMRSAKTEEERNVAKAEMEAAQASAAAHDKHRECSVCRTWVKTPPLAAVVGYVCADPLCTRHVKHGKALKAHREYCGDDAAWSGRYEEEYDDWREQDDYDY